MLVVSLLAALVQTPAPRCELVGEPWLAGWVGEGRAARAVDAKLGEAIAVHVVAPGKLDGRRVEFSELPGRTSWTASGCPPLTIRWRRVEPRMEHVTTAPPNPGIAIYANAVVFGPRHGTWIGFDTIEYAESALPVGDDDWQLEVRDARPSDAALLAGRDAADHDLGTARLAATLHVGGEARSTPGAAALERGTISDRVFRYSVRRGDDLVGWLTAYFNVPYVFGSAGVGARSQAERFVGTDCADLIVAALRRSDRPGMAYSSVGGLVRRLRRVVAEPLDVPGMVGANYEPVPGDILALGYLGASELPRAWDHIVVLVADRGPGGAADGRLGAEDLVADIGDGRGLKFAPLGEQGAVRVMPLRARE